MRVSKQAVYDAFERAMAHIIDASNGDGRTSRAEMAKKLSTLDGTERALTAMFFSFVDHRDAAPGASVTARDLRSTMEFVRARMIDAYDSSPSGKPNGLSQDEIARMSPTAQLAVKLARELQAEGKDVAPKFDLETVPLAELTPIFDGIDFWEHIRYIGGKYVSYAKLPQAVQDAFGARVEEEEKWPTIIECFSFPVRGETVYGIYGENGGQFILQLFSPGGRPLYDMSGPLD